MGILEVKAYVKAAARAYDEREKIENLIMAMFWMIEELKEIRAELEERKKLEGKAK